MAESKLEPEQQVASIWALGGLTIKDLGKRVWFEVNRDDIFGDAGQLAYNFILAFFPLVLFLFAIFGILASQGRNLEVNLLNSLGQVLPQSASALIQSTVNEAIAASGGGKLTFGILFFVWSAAGGVTTMMNTLNKAYDIRESRPFWKVRAIAIGLTLVMSALVIAAVVIVLFGGNIASVATRHLGYGGVVEIVWRVVQWIVALFFVTMAFSLVYYYGPDVKEQHWYWITPGSIIGVLLWVGASIGFRVYLQYSNSYSKMYGALGAVIILLLWFYITGLMFLLGGEINAEIEHAAAERGHPEAKAEGEKRAA